VSFFSKKKSLFLTSILAYSFFIDSMQALPTTDAPKMSPVLSSKLSTLLGEGTFTGTATFPLTSALNGSVGASLIASFNLVNGSLVGSPTSYAIVYNTLNPLNPVILGTLSAASNYFTGLALQPGENFGAICNSVDGIINLFSTTNFPGGAPQILGTLSGLNNPQSVALNK
jgi:hypothetical protein